MINTTARIKDALRDGRLLKKYKFTVQRESERKSYGIIGEISSSVNALTLYREYNDDKRVILLAAADGTAHDVWGEVTWPDHSSQPFVFQMPAYTDAYMEITMGVLPVGTIISFSLLTLPQNVIIKVSDTDSITKTIEYDDDFIIDNSSLVYESVKFDERLCSSDILKFGLCEGSSLEFQYFGWPNIRGKRLNCAIEVQYDLANPGWHTFGMITSYNSEMTLTGGRDEYRATIPAYTPGILVYYHGTRDEYFDIQSTPTEQVLVFEDCKDNDRIKYYFNGSAHDITVEYYAEYGWYSIPMGYFTAKQCSRQASTGIYKVTAYNKLQSDYLDADATVMIYNTPSDGPDPDYVTFKSLQSMLLSDYAISEQQTLVPASLSSNSGKAIDSSPTFKVTGSSTTYYPVVTYQNVFIEVDENDRYKMEITKYISKLITAVNGLKYAIYNTLQNGSTYWSNFKNSRLYQECFGLWTWVADAGAQSGISYGVYNFSEELPTSYISAVIAHGAIDKMQYFHGARFLYFNLPIAFQGSTSSSSLSNLRDVWQLPAQYELANGDVNLYEVGSTSLDMIEINRSDPPKATLRDFLNSYFELNCQFGKLNRTTDLFSGVDLAHTDLYPADTLYPANNLYPGGKGETSFRSWYSKLWTDTLGEQRFRNLIITYKGLDANNVPQDMILEKLVDLDGTTDYIMDDNWLLKNMIWTEQQVEVYAAAMVTKLQNIKWFPFEMWAAGLPYLEPGDMIEIIVGEETHRSYVLQRQLSGIQNLQDTYINGTLDIF